jgi:uncharacterized protein YndB with AHSA1/START domain
MTSKKNSIGAVRKTVTVPLAPPQAFSLFTKGFSSWWPLATHSVGLERATEVSFSVAVGEQIVETGVDGTTELWGTVLELDPPHRIAFSWHPGRSSDEVTQVEVSFTAAANGGTVVELVHSGWERWEDGEEQAANYTNGWTPVIEAFVAKATREAD